MTQNFSSSVPVSLEMAKSLLQQRRWPEAAQALRFLADQGDGEAATHLGRLLMGGGHVAEAERYFRQALQRGENPERLNDLAQAVAARGDVAGARQAFTRALALAPDHAVLHCNLGRLLLQAGMVDAALAELKAAVACDAQYAPAQLFLGMALKNAGASQQALARLRQAAVMMPRDPLAQFQYGQVCEEAEDLKTAIAAYKAALAVNVNYIPALDRLGTCYLRVRQPGNALLCFRQYLALEPGGAAAHYGLGVSLLQMGETEDAIAELRRAGPYPGAALALAGALQTAGHNAQACAAYAALCQAEPENTRAALCYADALRASGQLDEARDVYVRAAEQAPDFPSSYRRLLSMGEKYPLPENLTKSLLSLASRRQTLSVADQAELSFALYSHYDRQKNYAAAIRELLSANAARRALLPYDAAKELKTMDVLTSITPAEVMAKVRGLGDPSKLPVFIVGMPRSGSSLVEQILSSHPDVFGAGEIYDFRSVFTQNDQTKLPKLERLSGTEARRLAGQYLTRLRGYAPAAKRIVDKLPWNFKLMGYIYALLPGAQIIHIHRNPMDTCFSCFEQDFRDGLSQCADLTDLGHYYRAYERMMAHWREVLPEGAFLDVAYEALVEDPEVQTRRMLAFCGLSWDPACLSFYQTDRAVRTASATQVRQPMYRTSVGRWRRYASALEPLKAALES